MIAEPPFSQISVGEQWRELVLTTFFGTWEGDHPALQRARVAIVEAQPEERRTHLKRWFCTATLDDLHKMAVTVHKTYDIQLTGRTVQLIESRAQRLAKTSPFRGGGFWARGHDKARPYHAFRSVTPGKNRALPVPLESMVKGSAQEGVLWPYRVTSPAYFNRMVSWTFTSLGQEVPHQTELRLTRQRPPRR